MLQLDVLRGVHSTGVAFLRRNEKDCVVLKAAILPQELIYSKAYDQEMRSFNMAIIGHNRHATKGKINDDNAHPFAHYNIIGAHNGTLINQNLLVDSKHFENDSDNLFWSIATEGIEKTWRNVCGAAAITYWNSANNTLNIVKNDQRPLFVALSDDENTLFWASEAWMISVATSRQGIKIGRITKPKDNYHYQFNFPLTKPVGLAMKKLVPFTYPQSTTTSAATKAGAGRIKTAAERNDALKKVTFQGEDPKPPIIINQTPISTGTPTTPGTTRAPLSDKASLSKRIDEFRKNKAAREHNERLAALPSASGPSTVAIRGLHNKNRDDGNVVDINSRRPTRRQLKKILKKEKKEQQAKMEERKARAKAKGIPFREGFDGSTITPKNFEHSYKSGCFSCRNVLDFDDENIMFLGPKDAVCGSCAGPANELNLPRDIKNLV